MYRDTSKNDDRWAFLEEIEAPMWVDLALEAEENSSLNIDQEWFNQSHWFHNSSSHQLKAFFSHNCGGNVCYELDSWGLFSPILPRSVSRSRGKSYRDQKWSRAPSCSKKEKLSSNCSGPSCLKTTSTSADKTASRSCTSHSLNTIASDRRLKGSASNQKSSITNESSQERLQQVLNGFRQGHTNSTNQLSILKPGLRKSSVVRPALRVETHIGGEKTRWQISSSWKSHMGESSDSQDGVSLSMLMPRKSKEPAGHHRTSQRISQRAKTPTSVSCMKSDSLKATKSKLQRGIVHVKAKSLLPLEVNKQDYCTNKKVMLDVSRLKKVACTGKENGGAKSVSAVSQANGSKGRLFKGRAQCGSQKSGTSTSGGLRGKKYHEQEVKMVKAVNFR